MYHQPADSNTKDDQGGNRPRADIALWIAQTELNANLRRKYDI